MSAIKISLVGDVRAFVSSFRKGEVAVEDLADEVEDLAKSGDKVEREFSSNFKAIAKDSDKAGKKVKSNLKEGFDDAAKEAGQSGAEAAQSFTGGFEDVTGALQETLAQAFQGFGPLGAAAGVALAAALGAALAGAADTQEKLAEARERAAELSQTLYENRGRLPMEDAISRVLELLPSERGSGNVLESWVNDWIDLGTNIDAVRSAAAKSGTPVRDLIRGLSGGDLDATARSIEAIQTAIDSIDVGPMDVSGLGEQSQLNALKTQLLQVRDAARLASDASGLVGESLQTADYIAKVDAIGGAWSDAMTDASAYFTVTDEGVTKFEWWKYLEDAEATLAAANRFKRDILGVPPEIRTEAERVFADQGAAAGAAYLHAYETTSTANKSRFVAAAKANATASGKAAGTEYAVQAEAAAKAKAQGYGPMVMPVKVTVDDRAIREYVPPTKYATIVYRERQVV